MDKTEKRLDLYADFIWDLRIPLGAYSSIQKYDDVDRQLTLCKQIIDSIRDAYKTVVQELLETVEPAPELH